MSKDNSETVSKKKRGRPPIWTGEGVTRIKALYPEVKTRRGIMNKLYMIHGVRAIMDADSDLYEWFQALQPYPEGVLLEVGMIALDASTEDALFFAREYRKSGNYKQWRAAARRYRLGEQEADALSLANALIHTVNDFWKRFPKLTLAQTEDAFHTAYSQVKRTMK